ncbi:hydroxypyruvate isomerase family protein [Robertmurraya massiliosenegalensis]|uniref:hydroxypyruvate isomerase family protein n=1 Tax=Robertmurraya TaxID=2837507 RepID=UPI0039A57448
MRFSVNLSTIFTEVPFLDRFKKAKEARFQYVECQFPYDYAIEEIEAKLRENKLSMTLINCPAGNWEAGDRGLAVDKKREAEFKTAVEQSIAYAKRLKVERIHCMAGIVPEACLYEEAKKTYIKNMAYAAKKMAEHGLVLLIEPINAIDMPGYFLSSLQDTLNIIDEMNLPNVKLQYDFYHVQNMHDDLLSNFQQHLHTIGHVQIADCPGRHEPGTGEIHYGNIFQHIQSSGYAGYVGLEYFPKARSEDSFSWLGSSREGASL